MSLRDTVDRMLHVEYACTRCGATIADGETFTIVGVMSPEIRRSDLARTDIQVRTLGRLLCAGCSRADAGER